jgi:glycosyltransferase involved in cell wall biosynthesis
VNTQESDEYRKLLDDYHCGINCPVDSAEAVAEALKKLIEDEAMRLKMGRNSRRLGEEKFDRTQSYKKIAEIIENIS